MPKKPETLFQEKVMRDLRTVKSAFYFKKQAGSIRGLPDIILCVGGFFCALELKVGENQADPLQYHTIQSINRSGGYAKVVWPETWPTVLKHLQTISKEYPNEDPTVR